MAKWKISHAKGLVWANYSESNLNLNKQAEKVKTENGVVN